MLRSCLQLASRSLHQWCRTALRNDLPRVDLPRKLHLFDRAPNLHGANESELVDGRGGSEDLAAKQLLYGRPANDRLDCRRRRKTSPHTRDDPQLARAIWAYDPPR